MSEYPRLCGGTFFTLVLQALKQRMDARAHYAGETDGLSDPEVMAGLMKVINPNYKNPSRDKAKSMANSYKQCSNSGTLYLPVYDEQSVSAFDKTIKTAYQDALNRMIEFVNENLDVSAPVHKDVNLVRAVVDLIRQDQSIEPTNEFYVWPNGEKIKKAALGGLKEVCFPSFLLGVWHFIIINRKDNTVGKETYDKWCPTVGGAQRRYTAHMGNGILENLTTYMADIEETITEDSDAESIEDITSDAIGQNEAPMMQQMNYFTFNISGGNTNFIQHVSNLTNNFIQGVSNLTINNGEKQDE